MSSKTIGCFGGEYLKRRLDTDVFSAAIDRMKEVYESGYRVVVSFSAGKDSGVCLEVCLLAAKETGNLPLDVVMRDEEIMLPGTFEYARRVADRPDINFHWIIANQPIVNVFNRNNPYFWVFDPKLNPMDWVRQPPDDAIYIKDQHIDAICTREMFPTPEDKDLVAVLGLRVAESPLRLMGLFSSKGYLTGVSNGKRYARPIYDWEDGDVWKAHDDYGWDYNQSYSTMRRLGLSRKAMRIAPPTLTAASLEELGIARKAWPQWFERVCDRLPGVRTAALFGRRAIEPMRRYGETWCDCFLRTCITEAPEWIKVRAGEAMKRMISRHAAHSSQELPQSKACPSCQMLGSWRALAMNLYMGDPFCMKVKFLKAIEPEFFRKGAGFWGGKPTW